MKAVLAGLGLIFSYGLQRFGVSMPYWRDIIFNDKFMVVYMLAIQGNDEWTYNGPSASLSN